MPKISKSCLNCGTDYITSSKKSKFCCDSCRVRHWQVKNDKVPDFISRKTSQPRPSGQTIQSERKTETISGVPGDQKQPVNSLAFATMQKLQNDRNYYVSILESLNAKFYPFATIGGAAIFESLFKEKKQKTNWLAFLAGGYVGYQIDKSMYVDRKQQAEHAQTQVINKIREIDKQIKVLQESELKRFFEKVKVKAKSEEPIKDEKKSDILIASDVMNLDIPVYQFASPYKDFVGNPTKNFSMIVYGLPKSGKSNFAFQFASFLARHFGKVLFVASEEGISRTLQDKIRFNLADYKEIHISPSKEYATIKRQVKENDYKFVFIDSLNVTDISVIELEELRKENKDKAFISILQTTKKGDFKGSQEFAHNADVIVSIDNGIAKQIGRFNPPSELKIFR